MIEDEGQSVDTEASERPNGHASEGAEEGRQSGAAGFTTVEEQEIAERAFNQRVKRNRRRVLCENLEACGIAGDEAISIMMDVEALLPDRNRMTPMSSLVERLERTADEVNATHPALLFSSSGKTPLSLEDTKRSFRENARLSSLMDSEEGLLRAVILNERMRSGLMVQMAEHDAAKAMLMTELLRRETVLEHWRYMLPKFMLPVYSMAHAAGVGRNDLRERSLLFKRILEALIEWSEGRVTREQLLEAAALTEDQFLSVLKDEAEQSAAGAQESMVAMRDRLSQRIDGMEEAIAGLDGSDETGRLALSAERDRMSFALSNGAGLDVRGRVVLPGFDALSDMAEAVDGRAEVMDSLRAARAGAKTSMVGAGGQDGGIDEDEEDLFRGGMTDPFDPSDDAGAVLAGAHDGADEPLSDEGIRAFVDEVEGLPDGFGLRAEITDPTVREAMARRAEKFAKADGAADGFGGWLYTEHPAPFVYPAMREPDPYALSDRTLGMIDFVRVEVPRGPVDAVVVKGQSPVLGETDPLMFPPNARMEWYADKLGLSDPDKRLMSAYTLSPKLKELGGEKEAKKVVGWLRQFVDLRITEMLTSRQDHQLADAEKREVALDHLARWWAFMLYGRGNMEAYARFYKAGYFHGVHGPDCVLDGHFLVPTGSFVVLIDDHVRELERTPLTVGVKAQLDERAANAMQRVFRPAA